VGTLPASPFDANLTASIEKALRGVEDQGQVSWGVSTTGAELAAGWRPSRKIWIAGSLVTDWSGRISAGVKGQIKW